MPFGEAQSASKGVSYRDMINHIEWLHKDVGINQDEWLPPNLELGEEDLLPWNDHNSGSSIAAETTLATLQGKILQQVHELQGIQDRWDANRRANQQTKLLKQQEEEIRRAKEKLYAADGSIQGVRTVAKAKSVTRSILGTLTLSHLFLRVFLKSRSKTFEPLSD